MLKSDKKTKAVALKYQEEQDAAPVVIASGYGTIAEKIVTIAEQKGIPVFRDDSAASLMCMLEVGRTIPPELYQAVAAIYMQILQISGEIKHYSNEAVPKEKSANIENLREQILSR
ncbi:MAG: EscU/YscU/HrcU family type III secretion system export apparatus switch protein, partial [Oscillospiraceae bacterium]